MILARRLEVAFKAFRELGPRQVGLFAIYRLGLKSGYYRWATSRPERWYSVQNKQSSAKQTALNIDLFPLPTQSEILDVIGETGLQALIHNADRIVSGNVRLFGGELISMDLNKPAPLGHWTDYELGKISVEEINRDIKYIWEPARFCWVYTLARAYYLTGETRYAEAFWMYFETFWRAQCPYMGIQWMSAQEVALRLIALAFASQIFVKANVTTAERMAVLAQAIAVHAGRIPPTMVYARAQKNNHLLVEATGLYTAGMILQDHTWSDRWRQMGWKWFHEAIQTQIDPDGAYVQHSTNYHRLMLQAALWANRLAVAQGDKFPQETQRRLSAATGWLFELLEPQSGRVPNLGPNDGAYIMPLTVCEFQDYRPIVQAAAQAFWGKPVLPNGVSDEMALWLSGEGNSRMNPGVDLAKDHGSPSVVLRMSDSSSWGYLRVARFTSRPGHADQLHFDLWWRDLNVAQDPGTYLYNALPPWDNSLARSCVHNTLTIDGREQMTNAGRFLWLDWAQGQVLEHAVAGNGSWERIVARHTGYYSMDLEHRRSVTTYQDNHWVVEDQLLPLQENLSRNWRQTARLHWLLPDWDWRLDQIDKYTHEIRVRSPYGWIRLRMQVDSPAGESKAAPQLQIIRSGKLLQGSGTFLPILGWVSPTYGNKIPALSISYSIQGAMPLRLVSTWEFPSLQPAG